MNVRDFKIAICGAQGSGKTTLMKALNKKHGNKIVQADTRAYMPEGITSHKDLLKLSTNFPEKGVEFQKNIIEARAKLFSSQEEGFISDRSVFDSLAYYMLHNSVFSTSDLDRELTHITFDSLENCDITMFLSPRLSLVGDNSTRVTSVGYYNTVTTVMKRLLTDAVRGKENKLKFCSLTVTPEVSANIMYWDNKCIVMLNEQLSENGIAPTDIRIRAIERTCEFLNLTKENNLDE